MTIARLEYRCTKENFAILATDLMKTGEDSILKIKVVETYVGGKKVY